MVPAEEPGAVAVARAALAAEWEAATPTSPEGVAAFYRTSRRLGAELDAWHATPERAAWTRIALHVAKQTESLKALDVGCGAGHDLRALRAAGLAVRGVEPNDALRADIAAAGVPCDADAADAPVEDADLLLCFDVLEHVPDPESWLASWASRVRLGAVLLETTATFDTGTPLHLPENRGWHPGRCLEGQGFEKIDERDRLRVWQRVRPAAEERASLLLCAYRACSIQTMMSVLELQKHGWRVTAKHSDGLISRARSTLVSRWWQETADDVFLMVDDDIVFEPAMAERIVALCRNGHDVVCAAYPVRDGGHLAIRGLGGGIEFGPDAPPVEIRYAATGFVAVHRRVVDALVPTLPLCHGNQPWAFRPLFAPFVIEDPPAGGHNYLSEDWAFCELARRAGFRVWLDPAIKLGHLSQVELNVVNMHAVHAALSGEER